MKLFITLLLILSLINLNSYGQHKAFSLMELKENMLNEADKKANFNNALYYTDLLLQKSSKQSFDRYLAYFYAGQYYQNLGLFSESKESLTAGISELRKQKYVNNVPTFDIPLNYKSYLTTPNSNTNLLSSQGSKRATSFQLQEKKSKKEKNRPESEQERIKFNERELNNLHANMLTLLGKAYFLESNYVEAKKIFDEALQLMNVDILCEENDAISVLGIMENYLINQDYKAFEVLNQKLPLSFEQCLNKNIRMTPFTALYAKIIGDYYYALRKNDKAISYYSEAIKRYNIVFKFHIDLPYLYMKLSELQIQTGANAQALSNLEYCRELISKKIGKLNPEYAKLISLYAYLQDNIGEANLKDIRRAEQMHIAALTTFERLLSKENVNYSLAFVRYVNHKIKRQNKHDFNKEEIEKSVNIIEAYYGNLHNETIKAYSTLTRYYIHISDFAKANIFFKQTTSKLSDKINGEIGFLQESEIEEVVLILKNELRLLQGLALENIQHFPQINQNVLESNILLKGLLLSSAKGLNIQSFLDQNERGNYITMRNLLTRAYTLNNTIMRDSLEVEINKIEKRVLSNNIAKKHDSSLAVTSQTIKEKLKEEEVLLDFILIPSSNGTSGTYFCSVLSKNEESKLIKLFDENILVDFLKKNSSGALADSLVFNNVYQVRGLQPSKASKGKSTTTKPNELYSLIIKPLEVFLKDKSKIYISPDGLLNTISFSALYNSEKFLIDNYEVITILNPKSIFELETVSVSKNDNILLVGDVKYDNLSQKTTTRGLKKKQSLESLSNIKSTTKYFPAATWSYLPGTKKEIEKINSIFKDYTVNTLGQEKGSELAIKELSGKAPKILHVATHGFAFQRDTMSLLPFMNSSNPMFRSGLVMADGNAFWTTGKLPENEEDGILTAYEVSKLDFTNTNLTVLSACQTALGDVGSDGIYGLQRAFKIAGTKQLIVSLWEVSDHGTQLLMTEFYKNLAQGKNTRVSLREAQLKLRNNPKAAHYWWSGFVLIE